MYRGNPNLPTRPYRPPVLAQSRFMPGRKNPYGFGIERLMGNVPQPGKLNSIPGFGVPRPTHLRPARTLMRF